MKSLQNYLRKIHNREELTKDEFNLCRPKNAKPAKAHGLPKIHKSFDRIPKFRIPKFGPSTGKHNYDRIKRNYNPTTNRK